MLRIFLITVLLAMAAPPAPLEVPCVVGGCSGELCTEGEQPMVSACLHRPEAECYEHSRCERQKDGKCGWTQNPKLMECLKNIPA